MANSLRKVVEQLKKNKAVESIIQFGSSLEKKDCRDIDLCLFTTKPLALREQLAMVRDIREIFDISFYDDLPIHIKKEVLKGKILFTRNYYHILKQVQYVDLEYPRYETFLDEYHREMMAAL